MRKAFTWALALTVGAGLLAPATPAAGAGDVDTAKLRKAVTVNGILQHERRLQRIANANDGTRASNTPGFRASVDYVTEKLRKSGYQVKVQEFTFPFFRELAPAKLSQVSPAPKQYTTNTVTFSSSGDVSGVLVPTKDVVIPATPEPSSTSGCEPGDFSRAPTAPLVALVQRGTCNFTVKVDNAVAAGYDAVVIFNEGQPGRDELLTDVTLDGPASVPVVGLSYADGVALVQASRAGSVTIRVTTSTEINVNAKTYNVIADTPVGKTTETVVVGAHLDSVLEGPGINDDGSGVATNLEIAEQMSALNYNKNLRRQVRFAFWGAEESGLLGSEHYVANLPEEQLDRIYANLNFDMLGSPNYVRMVYDGDGSATDPAGPVGSGAIEKIFTDYFTRAGLPTKPTAFDGRSDYGPFIKAGIPAGGLFSGAEDVKTADEAKIFGGKAGEPYDACYHKACDDMTNLSASALNELGDGAAHAVLTLATSANGLYPDGSVKLKTRAQQLPKLQNRGHALAR